MITNESTAPTTTTTTTTTTSPISQAGGKYADHEFVKVASKVIKGVERAPYNKFETVLVNYDKMKKIKEKRNLTKSEQRIYDKTDTLIQKEFDAMFKKADTMLDKLDRKTPAQKGGVGPEDAKKTGEKDTRYLDSNQFYRWIVSLLEGIWKWIKDLFTGAFNEKFEALRKQFSADELFKLFGENPDKVNEFSVKFKEQAEKLQRLVATGIGGAASASIDMILNAFSMSPVFGTTILVWRMFQNMLMIMGASLSVQAANSTFSTDAAGIASKNDTVVAEGEEGAAEEGAEEGAEAKAAAGAGAKGAAAVVAKTGAAAKGVVAGKAGGAKAEAKNNVTKRLKTDIRQLNRSLKRYMHFPHLRKTVTMSGGLGSGYSYT